MRVGIFGGTFDPPHLGHLALATEAHHQLRLDRLLWALTPSPPHKPNQKITPIKYRIEMVHAIVGDYSNFELSRADIDRPPPHYAVETIQTVGEEYPGSRLVYILGGDSLRDLPKWWQAQKLIQLIDTLAVMLRPDASPDLTALYRALPGLRQKLHIIETDPLQISSTDIRRRVQNSQPYQHLLPPAVYEIIQKYQLY